ncbi:hypothetical protein LG943_23665 [Streptomonospora sp. S1-112]|uniref:Uncharacterized protein n=1 Tax=Streptomonospora mangrovi TaxID=2883123 RepID=A0A9X3NPW3_9ACTN|nr:hypothetical protein [Streptomonospora mangrovi]MDA0567293.1 hypothetical protein [Streptomonospora mangrovi]
MAPSPPAPCRTTPRSPQDAGRRAASRLVGARLTIPRSSADSHSRELVPCPLHPAMSRSVRPTPVNHRGARRTTSQSDTRNRWIRTPGATPRSPARPPPDRDRPRSATSTVRPSHSGSPSSPHNRAAVSRHANAPGANANCAAMTARFNGDPNAPYPATRYTPQCSVRAHIPRRNRTATSRAPNPARRACAALTNPNCPAANNATASSPWQGKEFP